MLVVRVHNLVPRSEWQTRYDRINTFERLLAEGGTTIVKLFLHISKEEQKKRLQSRLDDPDKRWKLCSSDVKERSFWNQYQRAYEKACRVQHRICPLVHHPGRPKWYRNLIVSRILRETLEKMNPCFPPAEEGLDDLVINECDESKGEG